METGISPAETTEFAPWGGIGHGRIERCFGMMMGAGCDDGTVAGSLGRNLALSLCVHSCISAIYCHTAFGKPVPGTIAEGAPASRRALSRWCRAAGSRQ
ncbi:MAG TPA: hypothetical protein VNS34_26795 [Rhizobiaceae bacterium]|nr:hypothetical protein [Rhizobiaceae bacterium]